MKRFGLEANSICLSKNIYWKIIQEASPPQIQFQLLNGRITDLLPQCTVLYSVFCMLQEQI